MKRKQPEPVAFTILRDVDGSWFPSMDEKHHLHRPTKAEAKKALRRFFARIAKGEWRIER